MDPGQLDRRLTILRRTQTGVTPIGEPIFTEGELRTVWAAKVHRRETEAFDTSTAQRFAARVVVFRTHHMPDLVETDRLLCEGATYGIVGLREIGRRDGLEITAELVS